MFQNKLKLSASILVLMLSAGSLILFSTLAKESVQSSQEQIAWYKKETLRVSEEMRVKEEKSNKEQAEREKRMQLWRMKRDNSNSPTFTYVKDENGNLEFLCNSIGFPPESIQNRFGKSWITEVDAAGVKKSRCEVRPVVVFLTRIEAK